MQDRPLRWAAGATITSLVLAAGIVSPHLASAQRYQGTTRIDAQTSGDASQPDLSSDGRYVVFVSTASLTPADSNGVSDIYLFDRGSGTTTRVSVATGGAQGNGASTAAAISADGRIVAFQSSASNLVASDSNSVSDVFVRDVQAGTTTRISVTSAGVQGTGAATLDSGHGVSSDGRYIAFTSAAANLVADDVNISADVFVRDRQASTTERASINDDTDGANSESHSADISADGSTVSFVSSATNLAHLDTNAQDDVFVHRRSTDTTELVSRALDGGSSNEGSGTPAISGDGKSVAFSSLASNLVASDTNGARDVFARNLTTGVTDRVSVSSSQAQGATASVDPSISTTGRFVAFTSSAQLTALDGNASNDALVRDRTAATTSLASRTSSGGFGDGSSDQVSISADGTHTVFRSSAPDIVTPDPNPGSDVYATDAPALTIDPFASVDAFVKQQYLDLALRQPTAAELSADRTALTNGTLTPQGLIDRLAHADFWGGNGAPVVRLYAASFVRIPDTKGVTYWIKKRRSGTKLSVMAASFVASGEFNRRYGTLTNAEFVDRVYRNVLDRPADSAGKSYWTKKLNAGTSRGAVMIGFSESGEYIRKNESKVNSILLRLGMFQATPNQDELDADLGVLSTAGYQRLVARLLYGDQYATRASTL